MKTVGETIKNRRIALGWTQEQLAEKMGYSSKSTINKIELGINDIPQRKIVQFAKVLGLSIEEIFESTDELPSYNNKRGILTIPFISQKLSAGVGIDHLSDADMDIEQIDILAEMARGLNKKSLVAARVQGDSMIEEHINSGDIAIFSRGLVNGEGIYVINYFGDVLIKRISYDPKNNTVSIISANKNYPTKTADAEDVFVLGKVVGVFHIMDI